MEWTHRATVEPGWIDYNGHLNVASYVMLFDRALDEALDALGLGPAYRETHGCSVFVGEQHVVYDREVLAGARIVIRSRVLDADDRRLVAFQEMWADDDAGGDRRPLATGEVLCVHVDQASRRGLPWPPAIREQLFAARDETSERPPARAGRAIGLARFR